MRRDREDDEHQKNQNNNNNNNKMSQEEEEEQKQQQQESEEKTTTAATTTTIKLNFVSPGNQHNFSVSDVDPSSTIAQLKAQIGPNVNNAEASRIRFIFRGQPLQDAAVISSISGLENESTVHMLIRPEGVPGTPPLGSSSNNNNNNNQNQQQQNPLGGLNLGNLGPMINSLMQSVSQGVSQQAANAGAGGAQNIGNLLNNLGGGGAGGGGQNIGNLLNSVLSGLGGAGGTSISVSTTPSGSLNISSTTTATSSSSNNNDNNDDSNNNNNNSRNQRRQTPSQQPQQQGNQEESSSSSSSSAGGGRRVSPFARFVSPEAAAAQRGSFNVLSSNNRQFGTAPGSSSSNNNNNNNSSQQQQQQNQNQNSFSNSSNNNNNNNSRPFPETMVHVHVTPDQLETLPDKLESFYSRVSSNNNRIHVQVEENQGNQQGGGGGIQNFIGNLTNTLNNNSQSQSQNRQQQQQQFVEPPTPSTSLQERVINAVRETAQRVGVPHFMPLLGGDWSPLFVFRASMITALSSPYSDTQFESGTRLFQAVMLEFERETKSTIFAPDAETNPIFKQISLHHQNESDNSSPAQVLHELQMIIIALFSDALELMLEFPHPENNDAASKFGQSARRLAVRGSGRVVRLLRHRSGMSEENIQNVLREVANAATPIMNQINPMLGMMVPMQGPVVMLQWAKESDADSSSSASSNNNCAAATAASGGNSFNSASEDSAPPPPSVAAMMQRREAEKEEEKKKNESVDSLDALLEEALEEVPGPSEQQQQGQGQNNNNNNNQRERQHASEEALSSLALAIQRVEGLDPVSAQQIMQDAKNALENDETE